MTILRVTQEQHQGSDGVAFRVLPGEHDTLQLQTDFGAVADELGVAITGRPGEPGLLPGAEDTKAEFGLWVPRGLAASFKTGLSDKGHQFIDGS